MLFTERLLILLRQSGDQDRPLDLKPPLTEHLPRTAAQSTQPDPLGYRLRRPRKVRRNGSYRRTLRFHPAKYIRLVQGMHLQPVDILHQRQFPVVRPVTAHHAVHRLKPQFRSRLRSPPPRYHPVPPVFLLPHQDRLQYPVLPDAFLQLLKSFVLPVFPVALVHEVLHVYPFHKILHLL